MLALQYCDKCTTYECEVLKEFLTDYNSFNKKKYKLIECPDKKNKEKKGKKPDFLIRDDTTEEIVVVEHKRVFHSYGRGKETGKNIAKENIRNILYSYVSYILSDIIEKYGIKKKLIAEIVIFEKTKEKYIEEDFIPKIYEDFKDKIINNQYYLYEDDILRLEVKENFYNISQDQIQFMFPVNTKKGDINKGITFNEFFQRSLDYHGLIEKIDNTISKKCKEKFDRYNQYKKIILLELIFSYGDEIVLDINKLNPNDGFSFKELKKLFINNYNVDNYYFTDEIILYYASNDIKKLVKLK